MSTKESPTREQPARASRWEDYIDVFFSPAELYERRARDSVKPAFWTLLVLGALIYYAFLPVNQMVIRASMIAQAEAQGTDPAQMEAAAGGVVKMMSYGGGIMVAVGLVITLALTALLLWVIGRLVEVKGTYHQAFLIATYAGFIYLLAQLAGSVAGLIAGEGLDPMRDMSFGLMRFLDAKALPDTLPPLLRRTEVFLIWQAVVWAVGMRVVMKASKAQAAITAAAAWLLWAVPGVISAALGFGQQAAR